MKTKDESHTLADAAKNVGHKLAQGAEKAVAFAKDETGECGPAEGADAGFAGIEEQMDVIASCGKKIGVVDRVEGTTIKLTKKDSPDGHHHFIPFGWIERVDRHVHLKKNSEETEQNWKADAASCASGG